MNPDITITESQPDDAAGIRSVQQATWLCTYPNPAAGITRQDIEDKLEQMNAGSVERLQHYIKEVADTKLWVAKDQEKVVGFIRADKKESAANNIRALYVLAGYHGQGIGKALMKHALEWLGTEKDIVLEVVTYNAKAIQFYKSFGFVENGEVFKEVAKLPSGAVMPQIEMIKKFN